MRRVALALGLLAGCQAPELRIKLTWPDADDQETIEQAADILGVPIRFVDRSRGAVRVLTVGICDERFAGMEWNDEDRGCYPQIVTSPDPIVIAHELGHAMGLGHVDDPANLMNDTAIADHLTDAQLKEVDRGVARLARRCP